MLVAELPCSGETVDGARDVLGRGVERRLVQPLLQGGQGPGVGDQREWTGVRRVEPVARDMGEALLGDLPRLMRGEAL